eukprot:Nk52_evm74s1992 gene=Nk52_evmTU74s1992
MPGYGQLVIGPPGSGKSTYCRGQYEFLTGLGRDVAVVNLDPANEHLPYPCALDIMDLVCLDAAVEEYALGPNGGLIYCMEYLAENVDWLREKLLDPEGGLRDKYLLIDCPGQVELYTHNHAMRTIVECLTGGGGGDQRREGEESVDLRLVAVHLVDSHYCSDSAKFISVLLTSLATMLHLELPHVNVLSKIDMIEKYGKLQFNLDFYTDVMDLSYLLHGLDGRGGSFEREEEEEEEGWGRKRGVSGDGKENMEGGKVEEDSGKKKRKKKKKKKKKAQRFFEKYFKLNEALCGLIEDYNLVSFHTLNIEDKDTMGRLIKAVDKANGYVFGGLEEGNDSIMQTAAGEYDFKYFDAMEVQEKYLLDDDE